jgi:hypothetical protein
LSRGDVGRSGSGNYDAAMKYVLATVIALTLWIPTASAQDGAQRCGDLPPPVAKTSQAIHDAASARDYDALAELAGAGEFTYSFGDPGGDPIAFWKSVDADGRTSALSSPPSSRWVAPSRSTRKRPNTPIQQLPRWPMPI